MENGKQRSRSSRKMLDDINDQDFFSQCQYDDDNKSNKSKSNPSKRNQKLAGKVD